MGKQKDCHFGFASRGSTVGRTMVSRSSVKGFEASCCGHFIKFMERRKSVILTLYAEVVQLVEQLTDNPNLEGLNPYPAGTRRKFWENKKIVILALPAEVVQLVEQWYQDPQLKGLNPAAVDTSLNLWKDERATF